VNLPAAQIALLHGILGVGGVAKQVARQRIDVVEMRQRGVAKTPGLFGIVVRGLDRHRPWLGFCGN
jgi:hypothetical protein